MRIKLICIIVLLSAGPAPLASIIYRMIEHVSMTSSQQKSLPQTVVRLTGEIYQKAKAEKNSPQMLKAYIWQMKFREEITPDCTVQWLVRSHRPLL